MIDYCTKILFICPSTTHVAGETGNRKMNLSSKALVHGGETLTVTCYTCGMPSSKDWAQKVRCKENHGGTNVPYYPFLLDMMAPLGAMLSDDGWTYLCAFCHASTEAQWKKYEEAKAEGTYVSPRDRKYSLQKFICAVCGVKTYRKRIRALPFQVRKSISCSILDYFFQVF